MGLDSQPTDKDDHRAIWIQYRFQMVVNIQDSGQQVWGHLRMLQDYLEMRESVIQLLLLPKLFTPFHIYQDKLINGLY